MFRVRAVMKSGSTPPFLQQMADMGLEFRMEAALFRAVSNSWKVRLLPP